MQQDEGEYTAHGHYEDNPGNDSAIRSAELIFKLPLRMQQENNAECDEGAQEYGEEIYEEVESASDHGTGCLNSGEFVVYHDAPFAEGFFEFPPVGAAEAAAAKAIGVLVGGADTQ